MADADHAVSKAIQEGKNKQKIVAAAPACLKGRVERGKELPKVEVGEEEEESEEESEEEEDVTLAVLKRVVLGGEMPKELYVDVMDFMVPRWDDARKNL